MKIVVFDLDETLGYFTEFGIFWDCLNKYLKSENKNSLTQENFNEILDLFPEFLRPNIINILEYLKKRKKSKCCHKMMIYTNNQGPKEWAHNIVSYFESKIGQKIFDQIISAFKINGKHVEICRTSHVKSHKDFIKCTKLPASAEICFLDDNFYPEMANDNIYYINVKPYYHDLDFEYMITKFSGCAYGEKIISDNSHFIKFMSDGFKKYNYDYIKKPSDEYEVDKILGKQIMLHLGEFFNRSIKNKTRRVPINKKTKTRRKFNVN
jgi:hypothetical protein